MKAVFKPRDPSTGYTYYVGTRFAWVPMYIQGTLVWMRRYWMTWPETDDGKAVEMYRTYYPYDPATLQ